MKNGANNYKQLSIAVLRWRFHTTQARFDDKSLVNNGTKKIADGRACIINVLH